MSQLGARRSWTSHEDIVLQRLAAAGKHVAAIAAEMTRSEAAIRSHAALLNLRWPKGNAGRKRRGNEARNPPQRPTSEDEQLLALLNFENG